MSMSTFASLTGRLDAKRANLFLEIERIYHTQLYRCGNYCAQVRALHYLIFNS